jgi:gliding motility-associated-like protein
MEIPNVFTPNGDRVNDQFFLRANNLVDLKMVITDRWGKEVYSATSEKSNISWDGKNLSGKDVSEGVYFYTLKAVGTDGQQYDRKGTITLIR